MCLTGDHDVLTTLGWKALADVNDNDSIVTCCSNPLHAHAERGIEFKTAVVQIFEIDEPVYHIQGREPQVFDQNVTFEHALPITNTRDNYYLPPVRFVGKTANVTLVSYAGLLLAKGCPYVSVRCGARCAARCSKSH